LDRVEVDDEVRMHYGEADRVVSGRKREGCRPVDRLKETSRSMRRDDI
jgi:hypothetical protein